LLGWAFRPDTVDAIWSGVIGAGDHQPMQDGEEDRRVTWQDGMKVYQPALPL
jgi:hypothetical protein